MTEFDRVPGKTDKIALTFLRKDSLVEIHHITLRNGRKVLEEWQVGRDGITSICTFRTSGLVSFPESYVVSSSTGLVHPKKLIYPSDCFKS